MFATSALIATLNASDPTAPRITHYDEHGRIELSGKVLTNWVNKATNMLEDLADVQPQDVVALDLPAGHWRSLYWALAVWACGGHVLVVEPGGEPATYAASAEAPLVALTDRPGAWAGTGVDVIAVDTRPLSRAYPGDLAGAVDEAADLAGYGDHADLDRGGEPEDPACSDRGYTLTFTDLVSPYPAERVLMPLDAAASRMQTLVLTVSVLAADGSVVVTPADADVDHLARTEKARILPL